jgi:signal transduction histidine kinase
MKAPRSWRHLQPKLLLSHLIVLAIGVGGVAIAVQLVGPPLFDRLLDQHRSHHGPMGQAMTDAMQQETVDVFRAAIAQALVLATLVATLAALTVSVFVSRRITTPITRMAALSRRFAHGDFRARVPVVEDDEIGALAASFNAMADALDAAEQRRAHLIGDVAHEMRTPLTTVRGNLEGILDGVIEPTPELLAQLYDETGRLSRLIDDLQELSRVESGGLMLQLDSIAPAALIDSAVGRMRASFAAKDVALDITLPSDLPNVRADEARTLQVLTNLLSNALRHTPAGGQVIIRAASDGEVVEIAVQDTGIGIAPEHLPHIFERFYRADAARSRALGGSGIGLTITRGLVEAMGGTIRADSAGVGHGTTVAFTLPATRFS